MLDHLGETAAGASVEGAVARLLADGRVRSGTAGQPTDEIGDLVVGEIRRGR
jgi:isocitrate/isopropylmalate dehydrogenase